MVYTEVMGLQRLKDQILLNRPPRGLAVNKLLARLLAKMRRKKILGKDPIVLCVSYVSAAKMQELNRKYRKKNRPTDVLSFENPERSLKGVQLLGDLVICTAVMRSQAKFHGHAAKIENEILLCHGLLHLLGMDHERGAAAARKMTQAEQAILGKSVGLIGRVSK